MIQLLIKHSFLTKEKEVNFIFLQESLILEKFSSFTHTNVDQEHDSFNSREQLEFRKDMMVWVPRACDDLPPIISGNLEPADGEGVSDPKP